MLAASPEYKKDIKLVKFSRTYFVDFFARYGWKWGIHKRNKKYSPEQVIQDEVNPIRERIKNFSANNIWNADETAIFIAILSKEKETILKAWEKTNLKADFDFDRELENQDVEEEFLLQIKMDELMINDEDEATGEDSEIIDEPVLVLPAIAAKKKEAKQSQITDFFKSTK